MLMGIHHQTILRQIIRARVTLKKTIVQLKISMLGQTLMPWLRELIKLKISLEEQQDHGGYITATKANGGWQISDTDTGDSFGFVSDSGDITDYDNGGTQTVTTYNEILHAQQNGGQVKP